MDTNKCFKVSRTCYLKPILVKMTQFLSDFYEAMVISLTKTRSVREKNRRHERGMRAREEEVRPPIRLQQNPTPSNSIQGFNSFTRRPDLSFAIFPAHVESKFKRAQIQTLSTMSSENSYITSLGFILCL